MSTQAHPFLKWAGGKRQLLPEIRTCYPFDSGVYTRYAEPFVGGGAVLFDILSNYAVDEVYISDSNAALISTYTSIRDKPEELIEMLKDMQNKYLALPLDQRKAQYLTKRAEFNALQQGLRKAALLIFLNRTCYNGLYRVNRNGEFNVPAGAYKSPLICDEANLLAVSEKLKGVTIVHGDYRESASFIDEHTFVYFDPPYRPISSTANFTAYTQSPFGDEEQIALAQFAYAMCSRGAKVMVSNSDTGGGFFEALYSQFTIRRVNAARRVSCKSRGRVGELLICSR